jgi:hypothetical protein
MKGSKGGSCKHAYHPFHSMKDGKFLEYGRVSAFQNNVTARAMIFELFESDDSVRISTLGHR